MEVEEGVVEVEEVEIEQYACTTTNTIVTRINMISMTVILVILEILQLKDIVMMSYLKITEGGVKIVILLLDMNHKLV